MPPHRDAVFIADESAANIEWPMGGQAIGCKTGAPETTVSDVRIHIAAHDPDFPAKREAAVTSILAAIDTVAQTHGFTKKVRSWAKTGDLGTVSIHLQRSHYGFDSHINLGFQPLPEVSQTDGVPARQAQGAWAQDDFIPLGRFYPPNPTTSAEAGTLTYLDVEEDATSLAQAMQILGQRALPWLLAHLTDPDAHSLPFHPEHVTLL